VAAIAYELCVVATEQSGYDDSALRFVSSVIFNYAILHVMCNLHRRISSNLRVSDNGIFYYTRQNRTFVYYGRCVNRVGQKPRHLCLFVTKAKDLRDGPVLRYNGHNEASLQPRHAYVSPRHR
jgi:hypothetical protein